MKIFRGAKSKQQKGNKQDENAPMKNGPTPPPSLPHHDPRYSQLDVNQDPRYTLPEEQYYGPQGGPVNFRYSDEIDSKYLVHEDPRYIQQQQERTQRALDPSEIVDLARLREQQYEQYQQDPRYMQQQQDKQQNDRRPPSSYRQSREGPPQKPATARDKFHAASAKKQQKQNDVLPPARQQQQQARVAEPQQQKQARVAEPQQQQQKQQPRKSRRTPSPQARQQQQQAPPSPQQQQDNQNVVPENRRSVPPRAFEPTQAPLTNEKEPPVPTANSIDPVVQMERAAATREVVKQYVADIWNRGDLDLIPEVCARGLRFNGSGGMDRVGHDGFSRMVQTIRGSLQDYHCEIHSMVVEGNKAFCRMRFTGRHVGQLLGYEATGKHVSWMGASEFTVVDGKIVKVWELGDMISLEQQLIQANGSGAGEEAC